MTATHEHEELITSAGEARAAAAQEDAFWRDHEDAYLEAYPDQFVAVTKAEGRVVAAAPDSGRLMALLREQGLEVRLVWVRFVVATPLRLAL